MFSNTTKNLLTAAGLLLTTAGMGWALSNIRKGDKVAKIAILKLYRKDLGLAISLLKNGLGPENCATIINDAIKGVRKEVGDKEAFRGEVSSDMSEEDLIIEAYKVKDAIEIEIQKLGGEL